MITSKLLTLAQITNCDGPNATGCDTNLPQVAADSNTITTILSVVFGILGVVCVFLLIYAGMQFITGGDDPQKVKNARNTIIWALIGLGIALLAEAIVFVVLSRL